MSTLREFMLCWLPCHAGCYVLVLRMQTLLHLHLNRDSAKISQRLLHILSLLKGQFFTHTLSLSLSFCLINLFFHGSHG